MNLRDGQLATLHENQGRGAVGELLLPTTTKRRQKGHVLLIAFFVGEGRMGEGVSGYHR